MTYEEAKKFVAQTTNKSDVTNYKEAMAIVAKGKKKKK